MRRITFLYTVIYLLLFAETISAQQFFFTNYTMDNGLSNNSVNCIGMDNEGYLWVGTEAGLNRFNGYDFIMYKSIASDSFTLPSNNIRGIVSDRDGNLWIGAVGGISIYDKKNNGFRRIFIHSQHKKPVSDFESFFLMADSKKNIWAGVSDCGLIKYDYNRECFIPAMEKMPPLSNNMVDGISEDSDGSLWLSSYFSLIHFDPQTKSVKEFENKLSDDGGKFQALKVYCDADNKNSVWIATWGSGLVHFDKSSGIFVSYKFQQNASPNLDNIVFTIHGHAKNKLWLATNRGIIVFDTEKKKFDGFVKDLINEKAIMNAQVNAIYRDNDGVLWIGSSGGLSNIHPAKQNFVNEPLWIDPPVSEFYFEEAADKIYGARIYRDRALIIYNRKSGEETEYRIPDADALQAEPFAVMKDDNGLIWIGTTRGIYTFDESKKKISLFGLEKQAHIPDRSVYVRQILKDNGGNLWFNCYSKGLLMIEPKSGYITALFHDDHDANSFPLFAMTGMALGNSTTIYACDERTGVIEYDYIKKQTIHYSTAGKKYTVLYGATDVAADQHDRIWVTTRNNGLICLDENRDATEFIKDDFGNIIDEQTEIAVDNSGKIWLTATNGIYRFDQAAKSFTQFTLQDGLPFRSVPIDRLSSGKFAMKTFEGIFSFDPLRISSENKPLQVHLTSLLVNGKISEYSHTIDQFDTITLRHAENNLTFEFAAINFNNPSSTIYSYMLEGNDASWSAPARTRTVNFSQLSPGNYWLRIRAGENSPEKKLFIQIIPAWWQTAGFKWFAVLSVTVILFYSIRFYLSFRYRQRIAHLERQREIEGIRMRISRDIHDEIGSGLTKIKLMSRNLAKTKEENTLKETTAKISSESDELIQNLGEIVWTINPSNDTLENVFAFMRNYLSKLFDENPDVKLALDFPQPEKITQGVLINPEIKRNLLLILKEALTNIFKHARATEVYVTMQADKSKIEMSIKDNGMGISQESQNSFGNGLKNMRKRAESINARFNIESANRSGTAIHVSIPLGKS